MCEAVQCKMKEVCNNNLLKNKKFNETFCSKECYLLDLVKYFHILIQDYIKFQLTLLEVEKDLKW